MVKKIAILTSGGDCAGLNAVIRAVTLRAHNKYNWEVYGIKDGSIGLLKGPLDVIKLDPKNFEGSLMRMGGTFLGSNNKGNPFKIIIRNGKKIDSSSNQILEFTKEVKNMDNEKKIKIIENLWRIIYSNQEADIYESSLMRRLAGLLYVDNKTMGNIKNKIKNEYSK